MQPDCFNTLGNMCNAMISEIETNPEDGLREVHGMLNAGVYLYIFENGRRINFCT